MPALDPRVYAAVAITVLSLWAILNVADALSDTYIVPSAINYIAGVVVGGMFGGSILEKRRRSDD